MAFHLQYVERLSVLATVTGNSQWSDLALKVTTVKYSVWEGKDGEGSETTTNSDAVGFKGGLYRHYPSFN
jgi:hypothetical protein